VHFFSCSISGKKKKSIRKKESPRNKKEPRASKDSGRKELMKSVLNKSPKVNLRCAALVKASDTQNNGKKYFNDNELSMT
jgi:hypothetical protein